MTDAAADVPSGHSDGKAYYVTTPIYYVNDAPHIGHAYTTVAGDVLTRWHRQRGEDVWFLTGTDEHGAEGHAGRRGRRRHARRSGPTGSSRPSGSPSSRTIDAANDDFIRTTEARHTERVREFWATLHDSGEVFEGAYEGPYCVACEEFKLPAELLDGDDGAKLCPIHRPARSRCSRRRTTSSGSPPTPTGCWRSTRPTRPSCSRRAPATRSCRSSGQGLQDLSITRSTFDWGIPVPWDDAHVLYVWIDALLNYATAAGYGTDPERFAAALAGRRAPRRQGHPALPRRDLAGDADGRRARAAPAGLRQRLAARRRREDEQDQAHRHPPVARSSTTSGPTRSATTSCARSPSGRTARSPGRTCARATRRARRSVRQPRLAAHLDGRALPGRRAAGPGRRAGTRRRGAYGRRHRRGGRSTPSTCRARSSPRWTWYASSTTT